MLRWISLDKTVELRGEAEPVADLRKEETGGRQHQAALFFFKFI